MNDKPDTIATETPYDDTPPSISLRQVIDDLAESQADEAAGRTDTGDALIAEMRRVAADLRAKIAKRRS